MALEDKVVDAVISESGFTPSAVIGDVDTDDTTFTTATSNNTNSDLRCSMPTPTGNPSTGADKQTFTVKCRKNDYGGGGSGTPTMRMEVWETGGGAALAASTERDITNTTEQTETFTWDSSILGTANGSAVEIRVFATKAGGGPTVRAIVDMDFLQWNVEYTEGGGPVTKARGYVIG